MTLPERSAERDAALTAIPAHVPTLGWTSLAVGAALADLGQPVDAAAWMFADAADMIEAYIDLADRRMVAGAATLSPTRLSARVRSVIALRLSQARSERAAIRRAAALLALPVHAGLAARSLARTTDSIWYAAGDRSADFSWYTKRAILAAVYGATLLFWLRQDDWSDPQDVQTLAFLDRRLAGAARLGKLRAEATHALRRLRPA